MDRNSEKQQVFERIELRRERAQALFATGDHLRAIDELRAILEMDPNDDNTRINLASAYDIIGELETALLEIDKAIELNSSEPQAQYVKGRILARQGKHSEGVLFLSASLRLRPRHRGALDCRSKCHLHGDDPDKCISDCDVLLDMDPANGTAHLHRGWAYLNKLELTRAFIDLDAAIRLRPGYSLSYAVRGRAKIEAGDLTGALDDANRAVELGPLKRVGYSTRSWVYRKLGKNDEADRDEATALGLPRPPHIHE